MKKKNAYRIQQVLALAIILLGLGIGADSLTGGAVLNHVLAPNGMDLSAALLALFTGFTLMLGTPPVRRSDAKWLPGLGAAALAVVPALLLFQQLSPEWLYAHTLATDVLAKTGPLHSVPDPGACLGFMLCGIALLLFEIGRENISVRWLRAVLVYGVVVIGSIELLVSLLRLDVMYHANVFSRMTAATATAISLTGIALWLRMHNRLHQDNLHIDSPDRHLTRVAVLILAIVAVGTGLTSFVVLKLGFELPGTLQIRPEMF